MFRVLYFWPWLEFVLNEVAIAMMAGLNAAIINQIIQQGRHCEELAGNIGKWVTHKFTARKHGGKCRISKLVFIASEIADKESFVKILLLKPNI